MITKEYKYYKELALAKKIVKQVYKKIIFKSNMDVKVKGYQDLVTNLDIMCEEYLLKNITSTFPQDTIVSEEKNTNNNIKGRTWIIDPIDGTVNFANNIPIWGIQLAFVDNEKSEFCVMYLPKQDELYYAVMGKGAYCNEKPMPILPPSDSKTLMSILEYSPYASNDALSDITVQNDNSLKIRALGSSCFAFCQVAQGRYGSLLIYCNTIWDYLPGCILCHECGVDVSKKNPQKKMLTILATSCPNYKKLFKFSKKFFD